jgi:stage II sporulation protein D
VFQLGQRRYRGRLQVLVSGGRLQAINHVPLESYLPSVVGSEMPASWPQEALRAQAVAARTYALRQRKPSAPFDVSATVMSQVYKGLEAETASTRAAVASTRGQVLMYGSSLANTVFHSSAGGVTENSGDLWTQQLPYLVSVPDFDQGSPVHSWEQRLEPAQLREAFAEIGGVTRIDVLSTTGSGRVRQARVLGPAGTKVVTGPELRSRLRLRSTQVRFEVVLPEVAMVPPSAPPLPAGDETPADSATGAPGQATPAPVPSPLPSAAPLQVPQPSLLAIGRGFGHGVGMSQWGALAMAQKGDTYERILQHYYRGTALRPYPRTALSPARHRSSRPRGACRCGPWLMSRPWLTTWPLCCCRRCSMAPAGPSVWLRAARWSRCTPPWCAGWRPWRRSGSGCASAG